VARGLDTAMVSDRPGHCRHHHEHRYNQKHHMHLLQTAHEWEATAWAVIDRPMLPIESDLCVLAAHGAPSGCVGGGRGGWMFGG
jgi:hypothetical protein